MTPEIRYVGLDTLELSAVDSARLRSLVERLTKKLCRHVDNECGVTVHCKAYEKSGERKKYSVHVRFTAPKTLLVSGKVHDWDIRAALHKAFAGLERRLISEQATREQSHPAHPRKPRSWSA